MHNITNRDRAIAAMHGIMKAERILDLVDCESYALQERAQRILTAAMQRSLEPRLYALAWIVSQMCQTRH